MIKEVAWRGKGWPQGRSKFRNVCRFFVVSNAYKKEEKWRFLKDALWGGGGVPTGAGLVDGGGRPRALIPGIHQSWLGGRGVREAGQGLGGGCKGFGSGGVGGRDTGPRDGANFATCVVFLSFLTRTKRRKIAFFEGCPVGWGGTHRSWPGGRGGRPRALVAGEGLGGA